MKLIIFNAQQVRDVIGNNKTREKRDDFFFLFRRFMYNNITWAVDE